MISPLFRVFDKENQDRREEDSLLPLRSCALQFPENLIPSKERSSGLFDQENQPAMIRFDRLNQLHLKEGQEMKLVTLSELVSDAIWSERQQELRPVAPRLSIVIERLLQEGHDY